MNAPKKEKEKKGMGMAIFGRKMLALLAGLGAMPGEASAAQNGVNFGINIYYNNNCSIVLQQPGTLAANPAATQLSSKLAGGAPGLARVTSFGAYDVTVDEVSFFLASPSGMSLGSTFLARFAGQSVYRGRTFAERDGAFAMKLRTGYSITDITVHLQVDRPAGFDAGNYTALTIVRCE